MLNGESVTKLSNELQIKRSFYIAGATAIAKEGVVGLNRSPGRPPGAVTKVRVAP